MLPTFSQNLTLREAYEIVAQMNEERTEFDGAFGKKFELLVDRFSSLFRLINAENR